MKTKTKKEDTYVGATPFSTYFRLNTYLPGICFTCLILLWYGLGRPVITSEIGNWSVFVLFGWRLVFGIIMK